MDLLNFMKMFKEFIESYSNESTDNPHSPPQQPNQFKQEQDKFSATYNYIYNEIIVSAYRLKIKNRSVLDMPSYKLIRDTLQGKTTVSATTMSRSSTHTLLFLEVGAILCQLSEEDYNLYMDAINPALVN